MKNPALRKQQLRDRARRYELGGRSFTPPAHAWIDGYRAALKDVRRAAGKSGVPTAVRELLSPMR
jgi:hypothetical protein